MEPHGTDLPELRAGHRKWPARAISRPRVCFLVHFTEAFAADMCIDLGGRKATMTQQFLHATNVRTAIEHVCGKRMAHGMWARFGCYSRFFKMLGD
jgi:hypothetical protein